MTSSAVVQAADTLLLPLYDRLRHASLPADSMPKALAAGFTAKSDRRDEGRGGQLLAVKGSLPLSDTEFEAVPAHMRGLDRVVDPLAPSFMASRWVVL